MKLKHGPLPVLGRTILTTIIVGIGMLGYWSVSHAAPAPAGTTISNQARAEYTSGTTTYEVFSNTVETIVQPVGALTLTTSQSKTIGTTGGNVDFPHVITNNGNVTDKFVVTADPDASGIFDTVLMYHDSNCDGVVDSPAVQFTGLTPDVAVGTQFCFVVRAKLPNPSTADTSGTIAVKANGSGYPSPEDDPLNPGSPNPDLNNTDTVNITGNAAINVIKSASISSGGPGTEITYTLTATNSSTTAASGQVLLYDEIDGQLVYKAGTLSIVTGGGGASDAVDDSNADQVNGGGYVTALITAIPASGTATVEFTVTVEAGATGTIDNTPFFCYDNGADVIPSG
ncbi:hypothetical protein TI05_07610, partial [Achromatium sp. WMS3]